MKDFFNFNIGHLTTIVIAMGTFVYGYSDLNSQVKYSRNEVTVLRAEMSSMRDTRVVDNKEVAQQLATIVTVTTKMGTDIDWIKKNLK